MPVVSFRKNKEACGVYYNIGTISLRILVGQIKFKAEDRNAVESQNHSLAGAGMDF